MENSNSSTQNSEAILLCSGNIIRGNANDMAANIGTALGGVDSQGSSFQLPIDAEESMLVRLFADEHQFIISSGPPSHCSFWKILFYFSIGLLTTL